MLNEDVEREIEKLKLKKVEITNRLNLTDDFELHDELERQTATINDQIRTLEKLRQK
ncbi:MAG: hypothetical protein V1944_01480 [Candidatus Aenigmatarchaeota archaeon]